MAQSKITFSYSEHRPCWVDGRRAIFHRWTDSARPVKPIGKVEDSDERLQKWSVHGLVEYENGQVEREWPSKIRFADSEEHFEQFDWETMEEKRDALPYANPVEITDETDQAKLQAAAVDYLKEMDQVETPAFIIEEFPCTGCAHEHDNEEFCETVSYNCHDCDVLGCIYKHCDAGSNREEQHAI